MLSVILGFSLMYNVSAAAISFLVSSLSDVLVFYVTLSRKLCAGGGKSFWVAAVFFYLLFVMHPLVTHEMVESKHGQ